MLRNKMENFVKKTKGMSKVAVTMTAAAMVVFATLVSPAQALEKDGEAMAPYSEEVLEMKQSSAVTLSSTDPIGFSFKLLAKGKKKDSSAKKKPLQTGNAYINVQNLSKKEYTTIYLRVREAGTGATATDCITVSGKGKQYPPYYNGRGKKGTSYFLRAQTNSSSNYGATVGGKWNP